MKMAGESRPFFVMIKVMDSYFSYGEEAIQSLTTNDPILGEVIHRIGHVFREVDPDLFTAVIHQMVGQQISSKALNTIWKRMNVGLGTINAETVLNAGSTKLRSFGLSSRKCEYVIAFAKRVKDGSFPLYQLPFLSDEEVDKELCSLSGVGQWTAKMILLFCLQRQDVFSADDLAILRGLRMVYQKQKISSAFFERCRKRYRPYASVASLYLWEVAGGAIPALHDPANKKERKR